MKAKYILTAVFSAALLSSCSDFLDIQKEGEPTTTQYFTNDDQAVDAIDALYAPIHQEGLFGRELYWEQGGACDIVWGRTRSYPTLANLQYTGDDFPASFQSYTLDFQDMILLLPHCTLGLIFLRHLPCD